MSGVVKLTSGDDSWWDLTRSRLSLLVAAVADRDRLVGRSKSATVQEIFGCVLSRRRNYRSFFIWAPRRLRCLPVGFPVFLADHDRGDGGIIVFFNLLTIALCLLLMR